MCEFPGARWWKFDFHTHTPVSDDFMNGRPQADKDAFTHREWLQACLDAELDCVVVTDHNGGGWIDGLNNELARMKGASETGERNLVIFPGVEISSSGGLHILGILDQAQGSAEIHALIGAAGYRGKPGACDECATEAPINIVREIEHRGGIAIMAHVDCPKGLWKLPPQDGQHLLKHDHLLTVEQFDLQKVAPAWITDKKPRISHVVGSDCHFRDAGDVPGARFTWIKMGTPSAAGLRMALLDGDGASIWHSGDPDPRKPVNPNQVPACYLESLEITHTKLMGRRNPAWVKFSPWMNALIGGRGTGKSSVVHFLRGALGRTTEDDLGPRDKENPLRKTFDEFMRISRKRDEQGVLRPDTVLGLILWHEGHRFRITWKPDNSSTVDVEETPEVWRRSESQEVRKRFKAQLFSQGEVARLAEDGPALLKHLDEKAKTESVIRLFREAQDAVRELLARKRAIDQKAPEGETLRAQFEDTKLKLSQFESHRHAEVLKEYQRRQRQGAEIQKQREEALRHLETMGALTEGLVQADLPEGLFDAARLEEKEIIGLHAVLRQAVTDAGGLLGKARQQLEESSTSFQTGTQTGEWAKAREEIKSRYAELTAGLKSKGIQDPSEYGRLVQDRQRIEEELKGFDSLQNQLNNLEEDLKKGLGRLSEIRRNVSRHRSKFLTEALEDNPFIQIEVAPLGRDHEQLETALRAVIGMQGESHAAQILQETDDTKTGEVALILDNLPPDQQKAGELVEQRLNQFKEKVKVAAGGSSKPFGGLLDNELRKKAQFKPDFLDEMQVWFPEDTLLVRYSPEGNSQNWKAIGQASKGQKSAALLAFLLSHGSETLILDQPEDDLDNHLIFNLVVRQLQYLKTQRQVIVVTHNANIVVNGDAEYVHVMEVHEGQCQAKLSGCLQEKAIRDEICEVMEGGRIAFEQRYRRINPEGT